MEVADLSPGYTDTLDEQGGAKVEIVRSAAALEVKACLALQLKRRGRLRKGACQSLELRERKAPAMKLAGYPVIQRP
jgi:hypothetical protein